MTVYVNNKPVELEGELTLAALIARVGVKAERGTAVALNNAVIPKAEWETTTINSNDKLTIIKATQGG